MKHLLSVDDLAGLDTADGRHARSSPRHRVDARAHGFVRRGAAARDPQGSRAARQDDRVTLLRGLHAHAPLVRDGCEAPRRRRHDLLGVHVVGEEGREPARHRADDRSDGHRRDRRAPFGVGRAAPHRVVVGRERRERGRRPPRAPHPGLARRVHPAPSPRSVARRLPGRDRGRHRELARRAQQRHRARPRSAATSRSSVRPR